MKSIYYICDDCKNEMEFISANLENDLLDRRVKIRCFQCDRITNIYIVKEYLTNASVLEVTKLRPYQDLITYFRRNTEFHYDIWRLRSSIENISGLKYSTMKRTEREKGETSFEVCLKFSCDTETLITFYSERSKLIFKKMIVAKYRYNLEIKRSFFYDN